MALKYLKQEPKFKDGWGETIKDIREDLGMTQQELADRLKTTKGTISRWEHEIMVPNVIVAFRLAKILQVDASEIFDN